jgi:hypothetical protein
MEVGWGMFWRFKTSVGELRAEDPKLNYLPGAEIMNCGSDSFLFTTDLKK